MAQQTRFWLYRAGTPVHSTLSQLIGHVVAVRPDAVLVAGDSGHERWFPASEIAEFSDRGLIVCISQEIAWNLPPAATPRSYEQQFPDSRAFLRDSLHRYDA
jgi:hypothetical protein